MIRSELAALTERHGAAFNNITKGPQSELQSINEEIQQARSNVSNQTEEFRQFQTSMQITKNELLLKQRKQDGTVAPDAQQAMAAFDSELSTESNKRQKAIHDAQTTATLLERKQTAANEKFQREVSLIRAKECPPDLMAVLDEMKALVDKAGQLEQEVGVRAGAALVQDAKTKFADSAKTFEAAESFHKDQAKAIFRWMIAVGV
jgi:hypothetical protein